MPRIKKWSKIGLGQKFSTKKLTSKRYFYIFNKKYILYLPKYSGNIFIYYSFIFLIKVSKIIIKKIQLPAIRPWIEKKILEYIGMEDEVKIFII
jgi:hypothetical protein